MTTPNLGLSTFDTASGSTTTFLTFRLALADALSNMSIIDDFAGVVNNDILTLQLNKPIIRVDAYYTSPGYYDATGIGAITAYTQNMIIDLVLDVANAGAISLNINSLGVKAVQKVDESGTLISLSASDLKKNAHNLFIYNSSNTWVWVAGGSSSSSAMNYNGKDLSLEDFSYTTDYTGATFIGAFNPAASPISMAEFIFDGADFTNFDGENVDFSSCQFNGTQMAGFAIRPATGAGSLAYAYMSGVNLAGAYLADVDMTRLACYGSNLTQVHIINCILERIDVNGGIANNFYIETSTGADFNFNYMTAVGAYIGTPTFESVTITYTDFSHCYINRGAITYLEVGESNFFMGYFNEVDLTGFTPFNSDFTFATFSTCNLTEFSDDGYNIFDYANFSGGTGGTYTDATFDSRSSWQFVNFTGQNLAGLDFTGVNLRGSDFTNADLTATDFTNANISGCDFTGATLTDAIFTGAIRNSGHIIESNDIELASEPNLDFDDVSFTVTDDAANTKTIVVTNGATGTYIIGTSTVVVANGLITSIT